MPAILLYIIGILFLVVLFAGGIVLFRQYLKKKQDENRISSLERDLAAANAQLGKQTESLKTIQDTNEYEKYAGLVVARMDRAVIIINQNRTVTLLNEYAKRLLDLVVAVGMPYKDVIHIHAAGEPDNFTLFEAAFAGTAQQVSDTYELTSQHGTFPIAGTLLPLMTGQTVTAVVFIFEDTSTQAARVKEEQAFFSAAAHELRTPLTIIRMTVSLLLEKFETLPREKIIEHLRRTDETTERMVRLVNEFLDISRIDQGRLEIKTERFDMVTLTDEVIGNLALLARERNLYVHHEPDVSERMVVADRAKAAEVLTNLISNGLKYTIRGGLTITHQITGSTFATTITDTGTGIPRQLQGLLFKRFGQIGDNPQAPAKSTGLGLYISKKLAELMRGDVLLEKSEPGTGSTFAFNLPLGLKPGTP
jgi:signal transduction histidine kinase